MKKIIIVAVMMVVQANAAHLIQAARASTKMPMAHFARKYSNAPENYGIIMGKEPIGNEWNAYARIGWDAILRHPQGTKIAQQKVRLIEALIRNKKTMVPARSYDECPTALIGGSGGGLFGFYLALELAKTEAIIAPLLCGMVGIKAGCIFDTFKRRQTYVHHLTEAKKLYDEYAERWATAQDIQEDLKKGFIDPIDVIENKPLPAVVLNDLYAESKRTGRIEE